MMRADIVHIKLPIKKIVCDECKENVDQLKKSIARFGLLQPIGVAKIDKDYRLIFGARRLKACKELNQKYIHTVLLQIKEDKAKRIAFEENFQRRKNKISRLANKALEISEKCELLLEEEQSEMIKNYLCLTDQAKKYADDFEKLINISRGNSDNFLKAVDCAQKKARGKENIRLSFFNDRRIFVNEIERIVLLMRREGFCDIVEETDEAITIKKIC